MFRYGHYIFGEADRLYVVTDDGQCSDHRGKTQICVLMQRGCKVLRTSTMFRYGTYVFAGAYPLYVVIDDGAKHDETSAKTAPTIVQHGVLEASSSMDVWWRRPPKTILRKVAVKAEI